MNITGKRKRFRQPPFQMLPTFECWIVRDYGGDDLMYAVFTDPVTGESQTHEVSGGGSGDDRFCARRGQVTFVATSNSNYGYAGLEAFQGGEKYCDVFLQTEDELEEALGPRRLDLSARPFVQRLAQACAGPDGEDAWSASSWPVPKKPKPLPPPRTQIPIEGLGGRCAR